MPKEEWGVKRVCPTCSTRFYDLRRNPMTCPACASVFSLESLLGTRTQSTVSPKKAAARPGPVVDEDDDEAVIAGDDDDVDLEDDVLEDVDDDAVDLDDLSEVAADED